MDGVDALNPTALTVGHRSPRPRRRRVIVTTLSMLAAIGAGVVACATARSAIPPLRSLPGTTRLAIDDFELHQVGAAPTPPWQHQTFDGVAPASYRIVRDHEGNHLHGEASGEASLVGLTVDADPVEFRRLRFRWRATVLPIGGDVRRKDTDDCALRLFVTFAYQPERASLGERLARSLSTRALPGSSLCYVCTDRLPAGTILPSAFTDRTQMIVLPCAATRGDWEAADCDLYADYTRAFGHPPPRISGLGFMVDADQTGSRAAADIDTIELLRVRDEDGERLGRPR